MITKMKKLNAGGFSLVELMVVVAIIGILASVAIPNFQRFQRKARQSEGFALTGGASSAEEAFAAEWNSYTGDLAMAGFAPAGTLNYGVIGAAFPPVGYSGLTPYTAANISTSVTGVGGVCVFPKCVPGGVNGPRYLLLGAGAMTQDTFLFSASSALGGTTNDHFTVDQQKVRTSILDGIP